MSDFRKASSLLKGSLSILKAFDPHGDCFRFARTKATDLASNEEMEDMVNGPKVVHGQVTHLHTGKQIPHGWVEHKGKAYDWQNRGDWPNGMDVHDFHKMLKPSKMTAYTTIGAIRNYVHASHEGPWGSNEKKPNWGNTYKGPGHE